MSSDHEWLGFNPNETEASESFKGGQKPVPNGKYKAVVTTAVRKHTKNGKGWFWELTFTIAEGEHEGKAILFRCNVVNPSVEAAEIGRRHLRRYLDCINNLDPKSEDDLCGIAVLIEVECEKSTFTNRNGVLVDGINNVIVKIDPYSTAAPQQSKTVAEPSKVAPWKR